MGQSDTFSWLKWNKRIFVIKNAEFVTKRTRHHLNIIIKYVLLCECNYKGGN